MISPISLGRHLLGAGRTYIVAELSANHNQSLEEAIRLVREAKRVGADAVKLQTYTPDTMTIDCDAPPFRIGKGTIWEGKNLYQLYSEAYTPWEWHGRLKEVALEEGMDLFSTPFDDSAVDFLEEMGVPAYKIASFELVDLEIIRKVSATGKPVIMSTGMATELEINDAISAARESGCRDLILLKCTSAYPSTSDEMNLKTIPSMIDRFCLPVGLSDHTLGIAVPVAAVALGVCLIEKHFTISRSVPGPDSVFSLEPAEFCAMVEAVRVVERALGSARFGPTNHEIASAVFRRSLFVVKDMKTGDPFTRENVRSIRPGHGLSPKYIGQILGKLAARNISRGTPLDWSLVC